MIELLIILAIIALIVMFVVPGARTSLAGAFNLIVAVLVILLIAAIVFALFGYADASAAVEYARHKAH